MRTFLTIALTGAALFCFSGTASAEDMAKGMTELKASLVNDSGKAVGSATFRPAEDEGALVAVEVSGLTPGWHGLHIHTTGDCSDHADHFKKAGGHMAEGDEKHGFLAKDGPHEGDLPNLWVGADGTGKAEYFSEELDLSDLIEGDGSALMIHAGPDDYKTDPAGSSGDRVACGVIGK